LDFAGTDVILYPCHGSKGNQYWQYSHTDSTLRHGSSRRCLAIAQNKEKLQMEECSEDNPRQRWRFQNYDPSKEEHR
jgi:polypeptide N-acetylgalactosaminyltransferase